MPAVLLEVELTFVGVEDRFDALAQWFEEFASRPRFFAFAGWAQEGQASTFEVVSKS